MLKRTWTKMCVYKIFLICMLWLASSNGECYTEDVRNNNGYDYATKLYGSNNSLTFDQFRMFVNHLGLHKVNAEQLQCYLEDIFSIRFNSESLINETTFNIICSNVLALLDGKAMKFSVSQEQNPTEPPATSHPSSSVVWGYGFLSVTIISLCSLVGISILPLMKTEIYDKILLYLIALGVGTLSSNVIFQLIPKAFDLDGNPMTLWQSAVLFGGFYVFYLTENILERVFHTSHSHTEVTDADEKQNRNNKAFPCDENSYSLSREAESDCCNKCCSSELSDASLVNSSADGLIRTGFLREPADQMRSASVMVRQQKQCWIFRNYKSIKTVAWMITVADGIHNFIDGLAIGASFSRNLLQGASTSLAIFCEEFPHELGDFAILISSGMTVKQAAFYNFLSACCCYIGLIVGIVIGQNVAAALWIFALAGGVFLYISLAGMLPEAQAHCMKKSLKQSPWLCMFLKNIGLLTGFAIMFLLTCYEDKIRV